MFYLHLLHVFPRLMIQTRSFQKIKQKKGSPSLLVKVRMEKAWLFSQSKFMNRIAYFLVI
jgi:hypothetical protein